MGAPAVAIAPADSSKRDAPAPVIDHRRFGPMRASFRRGSEAFVWECLDLVPTPRGPADLEFEAGAWGPTPAHELQLDAIAANLDLLTEASARVIAAEFGDGLDGARANSALEWQGACLTGRTGKFQLHYWWICGAEQLVTVSFERSQPTSAHLHD